MSLLMGLLLCMQPLLLTASTLRAHRALLRALLPPRPLGERPRRRSQRRD